MEWTSMQRSNTIESPEEELTRLRKLVKERESTISSLQSTISSQQQELVHHHRRVEMSALQAANAARNDADRFERTKNNMTRYGRHF